MAERPDLKRTPLYEEHVRLNAKLVPFGGFAMPVQYPSGIRAEHHAVRDGVGLFDVSHMGEFLVTGPQALDLVSYVTTNDPAQLVVGQAQYSAMCLESGQGRALPSHPSHGQASSLSLDVRPACARRRRTRRGNRQHAHRPGPTPSNPPRSWRRLSRRSSTPARRCCRR